MKLPERTFYDLASAANWLGCSDGDLDHYLKDDQLRYALPRKAYDHLSMASFDLLPDQVQEEIKRLRFPYLEDCFEIKISDPNLFSDSLPDFLYWKHSWMKGFYKTVDEGNLLADWRARSGHYVLEIMSYPSGRKFLSSHPFISSEEAAKTDEVLQFLQSWGKNGDTSPFHCENQRDWLTP